MKLYYSVYMSTEKRNFIKKNTVNRRFLDIALLGETIFHTKDLANLWKIRNKNTLYTTLSRYAKEGLIHRIHNGLYSVNEKNINPYLIGVKVLHGNSYISCESILYDNGVINQKPRYISLVGSVSKRFFVNGQEFRARKLLDKFLFNNIGIKIIDGVPMASLERAIADTLYFSPKKYLDAFTSTLIDWKKIKKLALTIGYNIKIPQNYDASAK